MKKGIKYLEAENKWLWYNHLYTHNEADRIEIYQYTKKGVLVSRSSVSLPPKEYRIKRPTGKTK